MNNNWKLIENYYNIDIPESTTCDEALLSSQVGSSSIVVSETNYSPFIGNFQKLAEEQENIVTSSTNDSLQNGPSS